ncbi:MAG TPA: TldD/PmbA family protein [Candidatus Eremiobacteraeota bacterium]|nr:TldD/PmbA family protein [Candidatus Eremiobacteraeota bacterium]
MEKLLELASKNADWAEIFYIKKEYKSVNFKTGRVYNIEGEDEEGITLRIRKNGKTGFTSSTSIKERENILKMATDVLSVSEKTPLRIPSYKDSDYPSVQCFDEKLLNLEEEELIRTGEGMMEVIRKNKPSITVTAEVGNSVSNIRLINTSGTDKSFKRSFYSISLCGTMVREDEQLEIESSFSSGSYVDDVTPLARKMVEDVTNSEKSVTIKSGPMPVIFSPRGFKTIYPPLYMAFCGDRVGRKVSPLADKHGEKIGPSFLTIVDDNTVPFGSLSGPMDDEGVPGERTALVTDGIVKAFYYDLRNAEKYNTESTGNGIKRTGLYEGFKLTTLPSSHPSNFLVLPGDKSLEELMKTMDRCLIVEDVLGGGQGNNMSGEFSVNVMLGFLWEKGEIRGRVKNVMIAGNVFELFANLLWIASNNTWEHSFFGIYNVPSMCFGDVHIATKD